MEIHKQICDKVNQSHKIGFPRVNTGNLDTQTEISLYGNSEIRIFFEKILVENQNQTMTTVTVEQSDFGHFCEKLP